MLLRVEVRPLSELRVGQAAVSLIINYRISGSSTFIPAGVWVVVKEWFMKWIQPYGAWRVLLVDLRHCGIP